jgi:hypothetical protein
VRDYKNIDRIFQENLKDYEVFPPNRAWNSIEKKLQPTKVKRRIPYWLKISSVAALLIFFFSVGTIYLIPSNNFAKNLFNKNKPNLSSEETNSLEDDILVENKDSKETKVIQLSDRTEELIANQSEIEDNDNAELNESNEAFINNSLNEYSLTDAENYPLKEKKNKIKTPVSSNRITVATIYAPIYINSLGDGSGIDSQFKNNNASGSTSYSYGVKFAYQLNNKFSVQSGVNMINLGLRTNDVYFTPGVSTLAFSNLSANPLASKPSSLKEAQLGLENKGSVNQVFGYVEIPVEIKYNVSDGKLGVNVVGGFSTLLLNKDEVFVETNEFTQSLGSSNNLRSINFSGNFGVDLDYSIRKNLFINVSPMFKIQTNTFSKNAGSVQPYYLGVYTGLNYKF